MPLPKISTPSYELTLPSNGKKVKYRPFLVKEQKVLMMAQDTKNENELANAMGQLVSACTFGEIDANISPMFDIEYIFLKIRTKSVGSNVKLNITCPDDGETKVEGAEATAKDGEAAKKDDKSKEAAVEKKTEDKKTTDKKPADKK